MSQAQATTWLLVEEKFSELGVLVDRIDVLVGNTRQYAADETYRPQDGYAVRAELDYLAALLGGVRVLVNDIVGVAV